MMPNYNPPPGYFNPSQTALQQGNYTQPNFTLAGQWPGAGGGSMRPGTMGMAGGYTNPPGQGGGQMGGGNPYGGQRFIPASHVGQYQTMNRGGGGGLGTSWGQPAQGGGQMPGGGGGGGGGMVQPNRQFAGLGPGYDQSTGQPWQSWQSLGLNLGIPPGGGGGGGGVGPGGFPMLGQARQNPQQSGLVDWIDQARAGDQAAQYNLANSYGWQQAAGGNVGGATDWLTRQGIDPKSAATMAGWVQANPNMWGGGGQAGGGMGQQPNYNPPPGYFNPSQTALQQGNYTQPNFTLAGPGGGGMNFPKPYQQQAAPNPPMANPAISMGSSSWPSGYSITQGTPLWDAYQQNIQTGQNQQLGALFADPRYGGLAQQVQAKTMNPQATVQKALSMGATPQQIEQWANLLGMGTGGFIVLA